MLLEKHVLFLSFLLFNFLVVVSKKDKEFGDNFQDYFKKGGGIWGLMNATLS